LADTDELFPPVIGQLLMMEVALALHISHMAMENHCMKISMFLKSLAIFGAGTDTASRHFPPNISWGIAALRAE
jgi:hypothetical protein